MCPGLGQMPQSSPSASSASRGSVASRELGVCHSSSSPAFDVDGPGVLGADDDATRQHPAAPESGRTSSQPGSTRQHPAAPRHPAAPGNPALTRQHPGNPATRPGNTRQPGNQGSKGDGG